MWYASLQCCMERFELQVNSREIPILIGLDISATWVKLLEIPKSNDRYRWSLCR
jgi:hypothetical protein